MSGNGAVEVWDVPTRLFHWLLVALLAFSWWSAENRELEWHFRSGLFLLALLVFRLIWGFIGSSTARFVNFVKTPGKVLSFMRSGGGTPPIGHNPVGGYSVVTLLTALIVQVGTGLFATDIDGLESGPLSHLVSFETGRGTAVIHEVSFDLLVILATVHVLAIIFYAVVRRRNLVTPMMTGNSKEFPQSAGGLAKAGWGRFVVAFLASASVTWLVSCGTIS